MKPKGKKGRAMVKKLGRTKKTGGFAKIAAKAGKKYGSKNLHDLRQKISNDHQPRKIEG